MRPGFGGEYWVSRPREKVYKRSMRVLGIETTCDETAAAVVELNATGGGQILSNVIYSQIAEHAP